MTSNKNDCQLKEDVSRELAWDAQIDAAAIGVSAHLGVVTLTGVVSSWAEKHTAEVASQRVAGVRDIANEIEIKPSWSTVKTDTDIALAVRSALQWHRTLPDATIHTAVSDHSVTLSGTVRTIAERDEAERLVRELDGVRCIENHLAVETPPVSPVAIKAEIENALLRHVSREAERISVDVEGDTVVLRGTVDSWAERRTALGAAKGTRGVRVIEDRLQIG